MSFTCTSCLESKSVSHFHKNASKRGYRNRCKECINTQVKGIVKKNLEQHKCATARWRARNPEIVRQLSKEYRAKNTEKLRAKARTVKARYSVLKKGAIRRGIGVHLSFEGYQKLVEVSSCHYCRGSLPEAGSGLDRIDSSLGYSIENCVPCCKTCNEMKMNRTSADFIRHIFKIVSKIVPGFIKEDVNETK